ncbi:MAG: protein kinase [Chloroflexi bacterium]|nr:protein kinase [Chloroflexota bacterium]
MSRKSSYLPPCPFLRAVFLETAVALAAAPGEEGQVYNDLESLLDKNILRLASRPEEGEPRFRMLLVIREYAHEMLSPEATVILRLRHARIYRQLAESAQAALFGPSQADWIRRLKWEEDNFRAALTFLLTADVSAEKAEIACGIAFSLAQRYWQMTGRLSEGRDWLNRILLHRELLSPFQALLLLNHIGWFAQIQEDYATAIPRHEEALALARQLQDQLRLSQTLHYLGAAAGRTGDYPRSEEMLSECLHLMRQDPTTSVASLSTILNNLGIVQRRLKKYNEAVATLTECRRLKEEQGDISGMASVLSNMGMVWMEQGDYDAAALHLRESLRLRQVSSDRMGSIFTLNNLASLACKQKHFLRAARLHGASSHLRQSMNIPDRLETVAEIRAEVGEIQRALGDYGFAAAYQEGQNMFLDEIIQYALSPETPGEAQPTLYYGTTSNPVITPTSGWQLPETTPLQIVQQELLAVGGMGEVYRAVLAESGQSIVIKRLRPDLLAHDPDLLVRFAREAEALRQLNHPNIVKILATFIDSQNPRIIMEYVPGGSLRDLLDKEGQLPVAQILRLGLELADALTRAHHLNIIHRDLKPANILLAEDGSVRLTDFGIAYLANHELRLTQTGAVMGTAAYLSPEACLGEEIDSRSDIWSFGVILAEVLTGKNPFVGSSFTTTVAAVIHKTLPDLRPHRPDAPPELISLIEHMLMKSRAERISSSRQVAAALDRIKP